MTQVSHNTNILREILNRLDNLDKRMDTLDKRIATLDKKTNSLESKVTEIHRNQQNLNKDYFEVQIANAIHDNLNEKYNNHNKSPRYIYRQLYLLNNRANCLTKQRRTLEKFEFPQELFFNDGNKNSGIEFDGLGIIYDNADSDKKELKDNLTTQYSYGSHDSRVKKYLVIIESKTSLKMSQMPGVETNTKIHKKHASIETLKAFIVKCKQFYNLIENPDILKQTMNGLNHDMPLNIEKALDVFSGKSKEQLKKKNNEALILGYLNSNYSECRISLLFDMRFEERIYFFVGSHQMTPMIVKYEIQNKVLDGLYSYSVKKGLTTIFQKDTIP